MTEVGVPQQYGPTASQPEPLLISPSQLQEASAYQVRWLMTTSRGKQAFRGEMRIKVAARQAAQRWRR